MPTLAEIQAEAVKVKEMKPTVRRMTAFGDDNHAAIDAELDVMERLLDEDEIYEAYEHDERLLDMALAVRRWMDGEEVEYTPSQNWEPLVEA